MRQYYPESENRQTYERRIARHARPPSASYLVKRPMHPHQGPSLPRALLPCRSSRTGLNITKYATRLSPSASPSKTLETRLALIFRPYSYRSTPTLRVFLIDARTWNGMYLPGSPSRSRVMSGSVRFFADESGSLRQTAYIPRARPSQASTMTATFRTARLVVAVAFQFHRSAPAFLSPWARRAGSKTATPSHHQRQPSTRCSCPARWLTCLSVLNSP
ncbi:hypothetical protein LZ31DRAFT_258353 [Colletotrichum somersetense]|nr:hypothetical protein LZ31DRAFT_258353 [Colletotrichum somersetense]